MRRKFFQALAAAVGAAVAFGIPPVSYAETPANPGTQIKAPSPPGQLFDLGGYKLHLNCTGHGKPTVVLSAGAGDFSTDWALVQPKVASFARVCSYDRSGAAWSGLGPKPRTMYQEAFDLQRLLTAAGEQGPYVMVGHSLGGMVVRIFGEEHPKDVVGMVLVDAYSEDAQLNMAGKLQRMRLLAKGRPVPAVRERAASADQLSDVEIQKINDFIHQMGAPKIEAPFDKLPVDAQQDRLWALSLPQNFAEDDDYMAEISAEMYKQDQLQKYPLGAIPLIVLTRSQYDYPGPADDAATLIREHKEQQAKMAQLSSNGIQVVVPNSGHHIQLDAPEQVVAAIKQVAAHISH